MNKLWLGEAIKEFEKKFEKGTLNIINSHAGSGKTHFISEEFLKNTDQYAETRGYRLSFNLNKVLYVTDTVMLKDSVLGDQNIKTRILEKGALQKAMEKGAGLEQMLKDMEKGKVLVITYANLGYLLKNPGTKYILLNHFKAIILDEVHNLFIYSKKHDNEKNNFIYREVINTLNEMTEKVLTVGLSATPCKWYLEENNINFELMFYAEELEQIRRYEEKDKYYVLNIMDCCKWFAINYNKKLNEKILIFTNTIAEAKKYKNFLNKYNINTEYICSTNNKAFGDRQKEIRDRLLEDGMLEDSLDCLIINKAYETGWNLRDTRVQIVLIDDHFETSQIQARNRCRHDIKFLAVKSYMGEFDGLAAKNKEGTITIQRQEKGSTYMSCIYIPDLIRYFDKEKYLGIKLDKTLKDEVVERYATIKEEGQKHNWKTLKDDLIEAGYIVKIDKHSTYIFEKDKEIKKDNKKVEKKMNNEDKIINYIETEWDKKRITVNDIIDIIDVGRKTFNKLLKAPEIADYLKKNRIKIGTIKGSKTNYMFKY